ncbi:hypothetical protein EVAR_69025_1 [Eumeta japonica]|uniref:Uncharacterized protein n=1 Tax=Eumeta variegata TaxID=151549 RepID=A0A4C2A6J0_EUMVA|nr:hypothetical protein EVAR_69025_1 [Eumeta japonica]
MRGCRPTSSPPAGPFAAVMGPPRAPRPAPAPRASRVAFGATSNDLVFQTELLEHGTTKTWKRSRIIYCIRDPLTTQSPASR